MSSDHQCLSEDTVLALVSGGLEETRACALLGAAEGCDDCSLLIREAAQAIAEDDTESCDTLPWLSGAGVLGIGSIIATRFQVLRLLGRGGMGEVYEALDSELGELVALKTIRSAYASQAASVERFRQEVRLARRVSHPHVCRVLEFGRHQAEGESPVYFLTMELLRGESLSRHLSRRGRLSALESVAIARQLCAGLSAIHAQGVLHRDIKPSNVVLCPSQGAAGSPARAVLLDFGIARSLAVGATAHSNGALVGTPDYMAPEQLQAQPLSPATDIYALGMVLFQLLAGKLPFAEEPTLTRALKRLQGTAWEASRGAAELPPKLTRLVARCLALDPSQRPQSAAELVQELTTLEKELSQGIEHRRAAATRVKLVAAAAIAAALGTVVALRVRWTRPTVVVVSAPPSPALSAPTPSSSIANANPAPGAAVTSEPRVDEAAKRRVSGPSPARAQRVPASNGARSSAERSCSPPYYFDGDGFRVYRKECL